LDKLLAGSSPQTETQSAESPPVDVAVPPDPAPVKDALDTAAELFKTVFKGEIVP